MHDAVLAYVAANLPEQHRDILEFGSRNINGSLRQLAPDARYVGVDLYQGPDVDIVGDAGTVTIGELFDVVLCAEVFEHAPDDQCIAMCTNALAHLRPGGTFLATMAGPGRHEHSAIDGNGLQAGEFYRNIDKALLASWLIAAGFAEFTIDRDGLDMRCTAVKGG